jgi:hypothetical protein
MQFSDIFATYYTEFRGDSDVPTDLTDPEWLMAIRFANVAINKWKQVDGVLWSELWTTRSTADDGDATVVANQLEYEAPGDFVLPGGYIRLGGGDQSTQRLQVYSPEEAQTRGGMFAYFTGNPAEGYILHLSAVADNIAGMAIDYDYYRAPTEISASDDIPDMADPYFIIDSMLADRFRAARNFPAYQTAKRDADQRLQNMITRNAMGTPTRGWTIRDTVPGFGATNDRFGI